MKGRPRAKQGAGVEKTHWQINPHCKHKMSLEEFEGVVPQG